jgi:hypothetical protein
MTEHEQVALFAGDESARKARAKQRRIYRRPGTSRIEATVTPEMAMAVKLRAASSRQTVGAVISDALRAYLFGEPRR